MEELPEVTLFITAYNEEQVVEKKMQNCRELDYPKEKFQIVWVTDGSCDATNKKLKAYPDATVYYSAERKGKTAAMNRGIKFITTPIVIFTDANTSINSQSIREMVRYFNNPKVGCVAGEKRINMHTKDEAAVGGEGMYWKYESFLKKLDSQLHSAVGAAGELFAIRTSLYEQMPNDTLLDDFILSLKIAMKKYIIAYCNKAYAMENGSANMKEEENHCYKVLSDYFHLLRKWEKQYAPQRTDEVWHPLFVETLEKKSYIEYLLDILLYDTPEEKKALVAEQRKEVMKLEQRIAGHTAEHDRGRSQRKSGLDR